MSAAFTREDMVNAIATAVLKDGSQLLEVMSLEDIERVRKVSRAANNGPWVSWFGEMARKTVMRRLSKRLPMSTDLEDEVFSRDETMRTNLHAIDVEAERQPEPQPLSRLDAIEHQITDDEPPVEPEVITDQAEELEAEIAEPDDERQVEETPEVDDDAEHPGKAIADRIIAEINAPETNAVLDVSNILNREAADIAALSEEDGVRVEVAADQRRNEIRATLEAAKKKEAAE